MLTEPGLSVIVSAIIGARKIFQVRTRSQPRLHWGNLHHASLQNPLATLQIPSTEPGQLHRQCSEAMQ